MPGFECAVGMMEMNGITAIIYQTIIICFVFGVAYGRITTKMKLIENSMAEIKDDLKKYSNNHFEMKLIENSVAEIKDDLKKHLNNHFERKVK